MSLPVVAIAGAIASGKTTIARAIATHLDWPLAGFGAYIRGEAQRRGIPSERHVLQHLGDELIAEGVEPFCQAVLKTAGWVPGAPLVIDGVRHVSVVQALRVLVAPQPWMLVYITVPVAIRAARLDARGIDPNLQQQHDTHATEFDVLNALPSMAHHVIDGSMPLDQIVAHLSKVISQDILAP